PQDHARPAGVQAKAADRGAPQAGGILHRRLGDGGRLAQDAVDHPPLGRGQPPGHHRPPAGVQAGAARLRQHREAPQGARRAGHRRGVDIQGRHDRPPGPQAGHRRRGHLRGVVAMSRIGKKAVTIPSGVTVTLKEGQIAVKGPKGELKRQIPDLVTGKVEKAEVMVERGGDEPATRARHGLVRALVQNMVDGVTKGFERKLEINGVGYKAEVAGDKLNMTLGFSHPINYQLPKGVTAKVEKNVVTLTSSDRELLGQTAAKVRSFRPPEPYKGKGVKYIEETIKRKVGKTGAA